MKDLYNKSGSQTVLCMGRKQEVVEDVPCGNTVALVGPDQYITKTATITNNGNDDSFPMKAMKFSVSPIVRVVERPSPTITFPRRDVSRATVSAVAWPNLTCDHMTTRL
jgi:elongation factor 2